MKTIFRRSLTPLKKVFNRMQMKSRILALALIQFVLGVSNAYAAADPFAAATGEITGYQESVQNLLYAIAAIIALVGAFNVYHKMTNGDQDVKKTIMLTLGGCIAMVALSTALPAFFGH